GRVWRGPGPRGATPPSRGGRRGKQPVPSGAVVMNPPISAPSIWVPKIRSPVSASTTENVAGEPLEIASTTARPSGSVPNSTERTLTTSSAGPRSVREAATSADGPDGAGAAGAGPPRAGPAGAGSARAGLVNVAAAAGAVSAAIPPPSSWRRVGRGC